MKSKTELVHTYKRYVDAISRDNGEQIPLYFKKFTDFLEDNRSSDSLYGSLLLSCIDATVAQVIKKGVQLKQLSSDWDSSTIDEFYRLFNLLNYLIERGEGCGEQYRVNFYKMWSLMQNQRDPCVQLYMHLRCMDEKKPFRGKAFYSRYSDTIRALMKAETEEEIDSILSSE